MPDLEYLLDMMDIRIKALTERIGRADIQPGGFQDRGFTSILEETLTGINTSRSVAGLHHRIGGLLGELTRFGILPSSAAWPRRYFYEKSYRRSWEHPHNRFIYRALDALFKEKGYLKGWEDEGVTDIREEMEERFKEFYALHPAAGWSLPHGNGCARDPNEAALALGKCLIRLFYYEGLAAELLAAWKQYEEFIYMAKLPYRDHFVHLVYDLMIGCTVIEGLLPLIHCNWERYSGKPINPGHMKVRVMRTYLIAALFHDIGYAGEILGRFQTALQGNFFSKVPGFALSELKLRRAKYIEDEIEDFLTLLSLIFTEDEFSFGFHMIEEYKEKRRYPESLIFGATNSLFSDQLDKLDHGVMSALFLLLTLKIDAHEITLCSSNEIPADQMRERYRVERAEVLEDIFTASMAIAVHNVRLTDYKGLTIDFRSHPTAFVLMLADDLHEWDRRAQWEQTAQAFRAIYGFNVFRRATAPGNLLDDRVVARDDSGEEYTTDTFFSFLLDRVKAINGRPIELRDEIGGLIPGIREAISGMPPQQAKMRIARNLESHASLDPEIRGTLKALLYNLDQDVITMTYVGGDPDIEGTEQDRVQKFWDQLNHLFYNNLSYGPAICVLHGYENETVGLFFAAEYSETLKCYVIQEDLKPKERAKRRNGAS